MTYYSLLVCLGFLFLCSSILVGCMCPDIYPFLVDVSICWYTVVHNCFSNDFTFFYHVSCNVSIFISGFIYLSLLSLFLMVDNGLLFFFTFSKTLRYFVYGFFIPNLYISALIFVMSFPLLILDFVFFLIFLVPLRCNVKFFEIFLLFYVGIYSYKHSSLSSFAISYRFCYVMFPFSFHTMIS